MNGEQAQHITGELQELGLHPAVIDIGPWINVDPGSILITTKDCNPVAWVETPFIEIG